MAGLSEAQKQINKYFPKKPIAYQPGLSLVFQSTNVGLLLSQLLYWSGKGSDQEGWVYKSIQDMKAETGLTRYQQETAIKICKKYEVLEIKLAGNPATRHFRIRMDMLEKQLPSLKESNKVVWPNPPNKFAGKQQTITKSTHETTSKNTHSNNKKSFNPRAGPTSINEILKERKF